MLTIAVVRAGDYGIDYARPKGGKVKYIGHLPGGTITIDGKPASDAWQHMVRAPRR